MTLASMIATDRNAFICDLAETYQIYDYRKVPGRTLGIFAAGLRDDSRIRQKLAGAVAPPDTIILARILDVVNIILWTKTKDAEKGRNFPEPFAQTLINGELEREEFGFNTGEEFEKARHKLLHKIKGAEN